MDIDIILEAGLVVCKLKSCSRLRAEDRKIRRDEL